MMSDQALIKNVIFFLSLVAMYRVVLFVQMHISRRMLVSKIVKLEILTPFQREVCILLPVYY